MMRSLAELRATDTLHEQGENSLGTVSWRREGGPLGTTVQGFEHAGAAAVEAFVSLHEAAHLWVHEDFEYDAWHVLDVDEPLEVGTDFVILRRRAGDSIASLESIEEPAPAPPRLAELRELVPKLQAAATAPTDRWIANLVASRVARADHQIIYVHAENIFRVQDLGPTRDDLEAWTRVRIAVRAR